MPTSDDFETMRATIRDLVSRVEQLEIHFAPPAPAAEAEPTAAAGEDKKEDGESTGRHRSR